MENGEVNVTRSFGVSGMPMEQWIKWKEACSQDFGDVYWLKIWSDHQKALEYDILVNQIMSKFEEQDEKIEAIWTLLNGVKEEKTGVSTLGRRKEDG